LKVLKNRDLFARNFGGFAHHSNASLMVGVRAVREVQARNVHASMDKLNNFLNTVGGRTECANNFGAFHGLQLGCFFEKTLQRGCLGQIKKGSPFL
jgi:hypothetical protein